MSVLLCFSTYMLKRVREELCPAIPTAQLIHNQKLDQNNEFVFMITALWSSTEEQNNVYGAQNSFCHVQSKVVSTDCLFTLHPVEKICKVRFCWHAMSK